MARRMNLAVAVAAFLLPVALLAETVALNPEHPQRYTIQKGDTLWDISAKFLREPWRWEEIWRANPQIKNPNLIYPGDEVVLSYQQGEPVLEVRRSGERPTVKLSPRMRTVSLDSVPVPTIPIDAIQQFLARPMVVGADEFDSAAYVVSLEKERLVAGAGHKLYVRGLDTDAGTSFTVYRRGDAYIDPTSGESLGYEAVHIADAVLERGGDPATMVVSRSNKEVLKGDRLLPDTEEAVDSNFHPRQPERAVNGQILSVMDGVSQIGQNQIVVLNIGAQDGVEVGHVMAVYQAGDEVQDAMADKPEVINQSYIELDPAKQGGIDGFSVAADRLVREVSGMLVKQYNRFAHPAEENHDLVNLPEERAGLVMVFRPYERISYALVVDAKRPMHIHDTVTNP